MIKLFKKGNLLTSSLSYVLTDAINKAIPFLILPFITQYLTPAEFGIVSNFVIIFTILISLVGVNIDGAISSTYFQIARYRLSAYIANALLISFCALFVWIIMVLIFQHQLYIFTKIPVNFLILATISAFFQVISMVNLALWRLEVKPLKFGLFQISQTVINVGLSLFLIIVLHRGWQGRAEGYIFAVILFGLISLLILYRRKYLSGFQINKYYIRKILLFGLPLIPHTIGIWVRTSSDRFILTHLMDEAAAGIYSTAAQFGIIFSFLTIAFNNAYIPYLYKKLASKNLDNKALIDRQLVKLAYGIMGAYLCSAIIITIFSDLFISFFLPPDYASAKGLILWIILASMFQGFYFLVGNYIFYAQKTKYLAKITLGVSILHLFICYIFVNSYGVLGAAYASTLSGLLYFVLVWYYSNKVYPMPWLGKNNNHE